VAKRATTTRRKADSTRRRSGAARKRTTSGRSGTQKSRGTSGSTRRRSTTVGERQSGRRGTGQDHGLIRHAQATGRAQDVETAPLEPTRGEAGDRLSPSRRRSPGARRRSQTSNQALAQDAEGAGGPDRSVGRERQGDELDERVMREGSNPRAAAETRER